MAGWNWRVLSQLITLRDIWEAMEGPLLVSDCLNSPGECPLDSGCPVHSRWDRIQCLIAGELESSTLTQLAWEANHQVRRDQVNYDHTSRDFQRLPLLRSTDG